MAGLESAAVPTWRSSPGSGPPAWERCVSATPTLCQTLTLHMPTAVVQWRWATPGLRPPAARPCVPLGEPRAWSWRVEPLRGHTLALTWGLAACHEAPTHHFQVLPWTPAQGPEPCAYLPQAVAGSPSVLYIRQGPSDSQPVGLHSASVVQRQAASSQTPPPPQPLRRGPPELGSCWCGLSASAA